MYIPSFLVFFSSAFSSPSCYTSFIRQSQHISFFDPRSTPHPSISRMTAINNEMEHSNTEVIFSAKKKKRAIVTPSTSSISTSSHEEESLILKRPPLDFHFKGYSIWLEIDHPDYTNCIQACANHFNVEPITPHVTALYGLTHLSETHARHLFDTKVKSTFSKRQWPHLNPIGILTDVELDGVNGAVMDMAWSEITLETSEEHEDYLDTLHSLFHEDMDVERIRPWKPHASLVYDYHIDTVLNLKDTLRIVSHFPNLTKEKRVVTGMALWKTEGKICDWELLDRFDIGMF